MVIEVRVQPRARRNSVELVDGRKLRVRVPAPPESGRANDEVRALLAKRLRVAKSKVEILRGHRGRDKLLRIEGLTLSEIIAKLSVD